MQEFLKKFDEYISEWNKLDQFRLNWWLKYPLYIPVGFFLEMRNLNKKSALTKEYSDYIETHFKDSALSR